MGARRDKGLALARYLTGHTGIPLLAWNHDAGEIDAPHPYRMHVVTARSLTYWHEHLNAMPDDAPHMTIRYDHSLGSIDAAWVGMRLSGFVPLLTKHYEALHKERMENGE